MSSIKNKIKFFENQNKQEPITTKPKIVNTSNLKKNISHWNKIRQDVLNKPYISQTTYAFGRNQTTQIPIKSKKSKNLSIKKLSLVMPSVQNYIIENPISENKIENNIENNIENSYDNDYMWMNLIIN